MSLDYERMTAPFGREYPPGFVVSHQGVARIWSAAFYGHRVDFPPGTSHKQVQDWCWEQHRRLKEREGET